MTLFMLDTNIAIKAMKRREPILYDNIGQAIDQGHILSLSVINLHELRVGSLRSSNTVSALSKNESFMMLIDKYGALSLPMQRSHHKSVPSS